MAIAGADCFLVVTPFFYKNAMSNTALIDHFTEVADYSPRPIIIYNVPANTGLGRLIRLYSSGVLHSIQI